MLLAVLEDAVLDLQELDHLVHRIGSLGEKRQRCAVRGRRYASGGGRPKGREARLEVRALAAVDEDLAEDGPENREPWGIPLKGAKGVDDRLEVGGIEGVQLWELRDQRHP